MAAEAHGRDGGLAGVSTGLIDLDQKVGGLHPSDLVILAARPSMGKTSLACNIAFDVARNYAWEPQPDGSRKTVRGGVVAFYSLEMSAEQLAMRLLAEVSGVSGDRLRKGEIDAMEFGRIRDAALEIQEAPLYIDATGGLSIAKLTARARRLKRMVGLDLVIVDYLQLITSGGGGSDNRVQEVSMITQSLKALAKELAVPVIALSQLSRQVENREDKKPQLSDLRESGSIEQDADMVMFVYRESYYLSRLEPRENTEEHFKWQEQLDQVKGLAEIIIGKQRHGPIGTVGMQFDGAVTRFSDLAHDQYLPERRE
jgi:replicative DNA helicase